MSEGSRWGAEPVAGSGVGQLMRSDPARLRTLPAVEIAGSDRFDVADVLSRKGRDQRRVVTELLDAGLSAVSSRRVLIVGVVGGVGVSTMTALVAEVWRSRSVRSVLLDASGHVVSGLAERVDGAVVSGNPDWAAFDGYRSGDLVAQFAAAAPASSGSVLTVGGRPSPEHVGAVAEAAAVSWPLVVIDGGNDLDAAGRLVDAVRPDLLVVACRPSVKEIRVATDWLGGIAAAGFDTRRHAVGVVGGVPMMRTVAVSAAQAALWDAAAGAITIAQVRRLAARTAPVRSGDADDSVRLLAAVIAACRRAHGWTPDA